MLDGHPEWSETKRAAIQKEIDYLESHSSRTHYPKKENGNMVKHPQVT